jgi:glycosyltransferase involved in cell wall biosynthesis
MKLSLVMPVYNEVKTIQNILEAIDRTQFPGIEKEVVIVDDGSKDGTRDFLQTLNRPDYKIHFQPVNQGKGAAIRQGFALASGDFMVVQDADLEYDPAELVLLLAPLMKGRADVVYGSRFIGGNPHRILFFWHSIGNKLLTFISNVFTDLNLTDMETCYKMFTKAAMDQILPKLTAARFNIEPEITARVAQAKLRLYEVGISYYGRTYAEGKKIGWKDGFSAIWSIIKFNVWSK